MTNAVSGVKAIDSLSSNEFRVEIDGHVASGIFSVRGLCVRCVPAVGSAPENRPLTIIKMVQRDPGLPFNRWMRDTLAQPAAQVTRDVTIVAVDEGVETRRWSFREAWISEISYSDFDSSREELVEERLTIQHHGVDEVWPER